MKERQTALILIGCAILLAVGSYLLLSDSSEETPVNTAAIKQSVAEPKKQPVQAPDWVNEGQKVAPDYTPATAAPVDTTPPPAVKPAKKQPQTIEISEDAVVTFSFVESLADYVLHRFVPSNLNGKPATLVSAVSLNKHFGRELDGFTVSENDIRASRKAVLDYAFTPTMLKTLYSLYSEGFVVLLTDTAATDERQYIEGKTQTMRTLTNAEIAVMLRLNSRRIERMATVFRAMGQNKSLTEMAGKYLRAAKAVERANGQMQVALADEKNTKQAGARLKSAILQRQQVKEELLLQLKKVCSSCPEAELFYLSQWAYRRVLNTPDSKLKTFTVAADILDDLAKKFVTKAKELE
ncbi:hypothetical protein GO013_14510 [Pseudodesulfovibrio sp. JC047]|uniref:hypothetical protein n=1 Tax=Pseudodesulfovibrio sp. JC047 TaxID=2683199 RepID=UPI0013D56CF3|nr:hypothetical protein [Pseudodesulfovibrio sp. JC047]NDV20620.1 hypothetical protein [Pseudodesulfovibrio sp. JC047]